MNYQSLLNAVRARQHILKFLGNPSGKDAFVMPPYLTDEQINLQWREAFDQVDRAEEQYQRELDSHPF